MMTEEQGKLVSKVYGQLWDTDKANIEWNEIDDLLEKLDFLNDQEMVNEATVLLIKHLTGVVTCGNSNCKEDGCFVKKLVSASDSILTLYRETKYLPTKNRYILANYLALSHLDIVKFQEL